MSHPSNQSETPLKEYLLQMQLTIFQTHSSFPIRIFEIESNLKLIESLEGKEPSAQAEGESSYSLGSKRKVNASATELMVPSANGGRRWVKLGKEVESLRKENRSLSVSADSLIEGLERIVFDENVNATEECSVENGLPFPIQVEARIHVTSVAYDKNKMFVHVKCPTVKLLLDPLELVVLITEFARLCLVLILRIFLLDLQSKLHFSNVCKLGINLFLPRLYVLLKSAKFSENFSVGVLKEKNLMFKLKAVGRVREGSGELKKREPKFANSLIVQLERLIFDENVNAIEEWSVENGASSYLLGSKRKVNTFATELMVPSADGDREALETEICLYSHA
ncbi:hypothetical protein LguiA_021310 [Lonicera macranthoides]